MQKLVEIIVIAFFASYITELLLQERPLHP